MGERTYSSSVLLHNWFEDITLDQDVLKDFINRKEHGELLIQKLGSYKGTLLNKTELAKSCDGYVHFGDAVLLINPGTVKNQGSSLHSLRAPMALTMNIDQSRYMLSTQVDSPCEVSGSLDLSPCIRNTFIITSAILMVLAGCRSLLMNWHISLITSLWKRSLLRQVVSHKVSIDGSCVGDPLRYGQSFALRTTEGTAGQLYLESEMRLLMKCAKGSGMQLVTLTDHFSFLSSWQVLYLDPQMRLEYDGYPVPANVQVLINHTRTNQALAALQEYSFWTVFGREHEITTNTFLDSHRAEEDLNFWVIVTGDPGIPHGTMFQKPPLICEEPVAKSKQGPPPPDCFTDQP